MPTLALLRHGQSQWNLENRFTGWWDVDLTAKGEAEARQAGALLKASGTEFDAAHVSLQTRAIRTLWLALHAMDCCWLPVTRDWRLNERHYGGLTGLDKTETAARHGDEQVHVWRRSYDTPPPPIERGSAFDPSVDRRYKGIGVPMTESLKTTLERVLPCWTAAIAPDLAAGKAVLVAAHGNSLRALVKHLFNVPDETITGIEIPTGNPLLISLDEALRPVSTRYLDEMRATPLPETA